MEMLGIRDVARESGISAHTLRYYERIGLISDVARDDAGRRMYSEQDFGWITFLTKLRLTGMPIRQMIAYAEMVRQGDHTKEERAQMLEAHRRAVRERIQELEAMSDVLDRKISFYRDGETP